MIIYNFNIKCITLMPFKADTPLFVDADGELSLPVSFESVKFISWIESRFQIDLIANFEYSVVIFP